MIFRLFIFFEESEREIFERRISRERGLRKNDWKGLSADLCAALRALHCAAKQGTSLQNSYSELRLRATSSTAAFRVGCAPSTVKPVTGAKGACLLAKLCLYCSAPHRCIALLCIGTLFCTTLCWAALHPIPSNVLGKKWSPVHESL